MLLRPLAMLPLLFTAPRPERVSPGVALCTVRYLSIAQTIVAAELARAENPRYVSRAYWPPLPATNDTDSTGVSRLLDRTTSRTWRASRSLTYTLSGATASQRALMREVTTTWSEATGVSFREATKDGTIRVSFREHGVCWSYLGTDALIVADSTATMQVAWLRGIPDVEQQRGMLLYLVGLCLGFSEVGPGTDIPVSLERSVAAALRRDLSWPRAFVDRLFVRRERQLPSGGATPSVMHPILPANSRGLGRRRITAFDAQRARAWYDPTLPHHR